MEKLYNWITISILILAVGGVFYAHIQDVEVEPQVKVEEPLEAGFEPLEVWVEQLGSMEQCAPEGTMDSGSLSYGRWCYKEGTFKYFVRKYDLLPQAEDAELMNWIGDERFQRRLTLLVFEDSYKNTSHWYTSVYKRGLGEPPELGISVWEENGWETWEDFYAG